MKRYILALLAVAFLFASCGEKEQEVAVTSVTLTQATAELLIGETVQLTATVLPSNASEKTIRWASSMQSVASVSNSGLVTALAEGTSIVTASCGGKSATCQVTVSKGFVEVTSISLNKEELSLIKGHEETLTATVKPDDATDKTVTWSSSTSSVATVDQNGKVKAVGGGNAIITAKAGNLQAACNVTVTVPVESISLDQDSITLEEEQSVTLVATVKPDDATDKTVTWSSSDNQIATVDESGKVTAVKEGSAIITAKAGDKTATCSITVKKKYIAVSSVTLNQTELALIKGQSETLTATVKPDDATDKRVTWSSSNTSVATVDQDGKVTAVGGGSAIITAKVGDKQATCAVTVTVPVSSVTLNKTSLALIKGQSETLTATVKPDDATDKKVTWSSSNTSIATVDQNGKVTSLAGGSATITAKNGDNQATCSVNVTVPVSSVTLNKISLALVKGQSETLTATVKPDDATDKKVTWSSSNTSIATVDQYGNVTAVAGGSATITAKAGDKQATCAVTVTVPVSSVTLNKTSLALIKGQSETLTATVKPDDATDKKVTWSSSNTSIATVDQNGKVTSLAGGSATITAKNGDNQATCSVNVTVPVSSVTLNKISLALVKGQSETLTATVKPDDATDKKVTWSSSNTSIATVDQYGKVTAVAGGSATITAKAGDKQATCTVTVTVPVSSITLNKTSLALIKGQSETLTATVKPDDATDKKVTWSSSNTSVATVDQNGKVTAVGGGSATITAKAGDKQATCTVTVTVPVSSVTLNKTSLALIKGQSETLTATVKPDDATDKKVTWSSSNTSVATVDQNGKVTAVGGGSATITAKAGDKQATCSVTVTVPVSSVTLNKTALALIKGQSETLTATVKPDDATDKKVTWSSSNTSVATVDQNGKVVAIAGGSATITAKAGDKQATCSVTVTVPVSSVTLNKTSLALIKGQSETMTATVKPDDATDKKVTWSSSNTSVATVDQNGKVMAVGGGSATITAKVGDKQATCSVTVTVPVSSVSLNKTELTIEKGKSETLTATVYPSDATDKTVTWKSSDTSIATVDQNGKITAVSLGNAVITVTTKDGSKTATCSVTVKRPANTEPIGDDGGEHGWD